MGRCNDASDAGSGGQFSHFDGIMEVSGAVIYAGQNVAMDINHIDHRTRWKLAKISGTSFASFVL